MEDIVAKVPAGKASKTTDGSGVRKYIAALRTSTDPGHTLIAMVKPAPNDDGLMLAHLGDCRHWVHVPEDAIEQITEKGRTRCGTHSHPVAQIELKRPGTNLELAFSAIADLHLAKLDGAFAAAPPAGNICPPGQHWGQDSNGNWGCLPGG